MVRGKGTSRRETGRTKEVKDHRNKEGEVASREEKQKGMRLYR